ncbi:mannonate oxidoreductase [Gottschalkiaceae bacterium SANA]|nr:mannonate oxidoreductase [Gottschalkiaceae bacterium SANA]
MIETGKDTLDFEMIRERLMACANSSLGKKKIENLQPSDRLDVVLQRQRLTTEAKAILNVQGSVPLYGISGVDQDLNRAEKEYVLQPKELIAIADFMRGCRSMKKFMVDQYHLAPELASYAMNLEEMAELEEEIHQTVGPQGVHPRASKELWRLNRSKDQLEKNIKMRINSFLKRPEMSKLLQDQFVSRRRGRFVVPVKAMNKSKFPGTVVDQSATGSTLFMEPTVMGKLTEELYSIERGIEAEVYQILSTLTGLVMLEERAIRQNIEVMTEYDFAFAKAKLSFEMDGRQPKLHQGERMVIHAGRHPMIEDAVPLHFELGEKARTLVITGPNTGGKTVVLKTLGLFVLMAQAGLHLPVGQGTELPIFKEILVDVGDQQDLTQSLSTFSGHMTNLVRIVNRSNPGVLVLLDEIGTGTDPREGAALGMAILEDLYKQGALTVVTTHYGVLKDFGEQMPGFENARMKFNPETLEPLYQLEMGASGDSNAFWISQELGLKPRVLARAKEMAEHKQHESKDLNLKEVEFKKRKERAAKEKKNYESLTQGDLVRCLDTDEKAIVYMENEKQGTVTVVKDFKERVLPRRRVKRLAKAEDLYPPDYDMSQLFVSFAKRKLEKDISKGRFKNQEELNERFSDLPDLARAYQKAKSKAK